MAAMFYEGNECSEHNMSPWKIKMYQKEAGWKKSKKITKEEVETIIWEEIEATNQKPQILEHAE